MFPTAMCATTTQRKVLRVLAEKNKRYTIAELTEMCHRSEATISRALQHAHRYPFIEKQRVAGSKQLVFRLDPESRYTAAIRAFFEVEHNRERQNGTIPVDVWNLLEDVTGRVADGVDGFLELFLFGSYATGEYYAGSDIDLLLVHTGADAVDGAVAAVTEPIGDDRLQVLTVGIEPAERDRLDDADLFDAIKKRAPVRGVDVLVPLSGAVTP